MTLLLLHHIRKGGGQHGEGITGGHAFLGVVDVALELLRADGGNQNQRKVRGWGRVIAIPELLYARDDDGTFSALGSPRQVALDEVKERVLAALDAEWRIFKEIRQSLDKPLPGQEQTRKALRALAEGGKIERDPPTGQDRKGATYRYRLRVPA
jgi:hypothetical protein